jgi:hypothetical protein
VFAFKFGGSLWRWLTQDWQAGENRPEDSFYLWGPQPPADFTTNREA